MVMVAVAAVAVVAVTSEVAERILVERILVVRILAVRVSVALTWAGLGSVALTLVAAISTVCRAATLLTSTPRTDQARPH
jgi:hypothetical protein